MLKTLRIQNFKGWKDTGEIKLAPITLFFGANSSGKSSIGQFLMMLKQTAESTDRKRTIHTGDEESAVNLGSFKNITYMHDSQNELTFDYSWNPIEKIQLFQTGKLKDKKIEKIQFYCHLGTDQKDNPYLKDFSYKLSSEDNQKITFALQLCEDPPNYGYDLVDGENCHFKRYKGRPWKTDVSLHFYGIPQDLLNYYQNVDFLTDINLQQERLFSRVFYLGPIRQAPSYLYSWSGYEPKEVGKTGKDTIAALLAGSSRKYILSDHPKTSKTLQHIIAEALQRMGLIDKFEVNSVSKVHQQYEVKIATKGSGELVNLPDVGFGISQILPVVTELFYVPQNSVIVIEQPELHLHPKAQAELADIMIDAISAKEKHQNRNIQLLIETHSEHFLRRFMRRLAENKIKMEQLKAYFVNRAQSPSTLDELALNEYGEITNWPKDFFGDAMGDISAQMQAGIQKRLKEI
jgi:hypothetical protein